MVYRCVMHELKHLSQSELLSQTKVAIQNERKATAQILLCFREIESRLLYAEVGFSSLHEMAVKYFGYSEGAAHRRISTMRLIKDVPTVAVAIEAGDLSLSVASTVQNFLRAEARQNKKVYSLNEKNELVNSMKHKSKAECERDLRKISPLLIRPEKERPICDEFTQITFQANKKLLENLHQLKGRLAHRTGSDSSYAKLFMVMSEMVLAQIDRTPNPGLHKNSVARPAKETVISPSHGIVDKTISQNELKSSILSQTSFARQTSPERLLSGATATRSFSRAVQRMVWKRSGGQCEFVAEGDVGAGRRRCASKWQLEFDHLKPFARGGESIAENARLLCRVHNQFVAKDWSLL